MQRYPFEGWRRSIGRELSVGALGDRMDDESTGSWWRRTFGTEPPTDDERRLKKQRERWQRNQRYREIFERDQGLRQERSDINDRIKAIASFEATKAVYLMGGIGFGVYLMQESFIRGATLIAIALGWIYWQERNQKKKFDFKLSVLGDLAEATVQHERIVELESSGLPWLKFDKHVEVVNVFDDPYWREVTEKAKKYQLLCHADRLKALEIATTASLPFRRAMHQQIREKDPAAELPNWAQERNDKMDWL